MTLGSGRGVFIQGGGSGLSGLAAVFDDAWVLDLSGAGWTQVHPSGTGPGGRQGAQGVPIGDTQVLFFGGYQTSQAADASLYLYDLPTNSYLSTFTPPASWSASSGDTGGAASLSLGPTYSQPAATPTLSAITQIIPTLTTIGTDGVTSTLARTTVFSSLVPASIGSQPWHWDPSTYTGILPGLATHSSRPSGSPPSSSQSFSGDDAASSGALSAKTKTMAIAIGTTFLLVSLAAVGAGLVVARRRRSMRDGTNERKRGRGEGAGLVRDENDFDSSTWGDHAGREKRGSSRAAFFAGIAAGGARLFSLSDEKAGAKRFDMLADEDTRRYDTYPRSAELGELGNGRPYMGVWDRSASFVGSVVSGTRRIASGSSNRPPPAARLEDGDIGSSRLHDGLDEDNGLLAPDGRGAFGGESPEVDQNPFADNIYPPLPPPFVNHPTSSSIPRSAPNLAFYPITGFPITSAPSPVEQADSFDSHSLLSSEMYHSAPSDAPPSPAPIRPPLSVGVIPSSQTSSSLYAPLAHSTSIASSSGWRKVLGLSSRARSPPPRSDAISPSEAVMGIKLAHAQDPAPRPIMDFDEDDSDRFQARRGHGVSMSSLSSAGPFSPSSLVPLLSPGAG